MACSPVVPMREVISNQDLPDRLDMYKKLSRHYVRITTQQFNIPEDHDAYLETMSRLVYPTQTFLGEKTISLGGKTFEMHTARAETNDACWIWIPEIKCAFVGDLIISAFPNVANPSAVFLSERPAGAAGSVVTASMEGTRPILVEIQALASATNFGTPRRTILGLDANRVALLAAVMEKKLGMHLMGYDIFMNVAGGVKVVEPAVDLAIVAAVASSFLDKAIPEETMVLGEVGLTGEVRAIGQVDTRISESRKMGFTRCLAPASNLNRLPEIKGIEITGVRSVSEAIENLF